MPCHFCTNTEGAQIDFPSPIYTMDAKDQVNCKPAPNKIWAKESCKTNCIQWDGSIRTACTPSASESDRECYCGDYLKQTCKGRTAENCK